MAYIRLSEDAELIAAVPALLGFVPTRSLVLLLSTDGTKLELTMRADLPAEADTSAFVSHITHVASTHQHTAVGLLVVGDGEQSEILPYQQLLNALRDSFESRGITVLTRLWTPELRAGAPWYGYDEYRGGRLPDPQTTHAMTAATAQGQVTYNSRDELRQQLCPTAPVAVLQRRKRLMDPIVHTVDDEENPRTHLATLHHAMEEASRGRLPDSDEQLVSIAAILTDPIIRDTATVRSRIEHEQLWTHLAREAPAPANADAATVLAISAYVRGDGALASVAVAAALQAVPNHTAATLLDTALHRAIRPEQLRTILTETAIDLDESS